MGLKFLFNRKKKQFPGANSFNPNPNNISNCILIYTSTDRGATKVFKKFDANGDGKICSSELGAIMGSLGHSATEEELNNMIKEVDANGDGFISLNEFIELNTASIRRNCWRISILKHAFGVFAMDKNGVISAQEFHNVLKSLGEECSIDECVKMISGVDEDGDGNISFEEFKVMMTSTESRFNAIASN